MMHRSSLESLPAALLLFAAFTTAQIGPVYTSSFTWNAECGPTVACGPSAAGYAGTGFAAANNLTYAAGEPIIGGVGAGCGQCWHLQPQADAYQSNGMSLGTPVVVKINDQCTDPKYCDQDEGNNKKPLNTGYDKQVHFDLCNQSGVTKQFFGQVGIGVLVGLAQQVDCSVLNDGPFGSNLGPITGGATATSTADEKSEARVGAGQNNIVVNAEGGGQSTSTMQPSTTLATVVSSSSISSPSPVAESGSDNGEGDDQDECDEL